MLLALAVILRLLLARLAVMVAEVTAGLLGSALGRIGRPRAPAATGDSGADFAPIPPNLPVPGGYPSAPAQPYAELAYQTPQMGDMPTPHYPVATPCEDSMLTTFHPGEA